LSQEEVEEIEEGKVEVCSHFMNQEDNKKKLKEFGRMPIPPTFYMEE